jgi:hypothetical protein
MSAKNKPAVLPTGPTNTLQPESYQAKRLSAIQKRRADIPKAYQRTYDKAVAGKSLRAAAKAFCLECTYWQKEEIRLCTSLACPLWPYRAYQGGAQSVKNRGFGGRESSNGEGNDQ